ncbi:MAG TPA: LysR family transcriptional regulator [Rhodanobacter sp.]|nr:LysR family transcriptional regulator [Rhodanobacter sp.]
MPMNTRDLHAFVAVVDSGSIVQAAATLHLTQPGVTRRVQSLETMLGLQLLDRQSKPLRPTAAGREVYLKGRQLLHAEEELMALTRPDAEPSGELRLGMPPFVAERALTTPIDCLRESYPLLRLRILAGWSPSLAQRMEQGDLDVVVVVFPENMPPPAGMLAHELGRQAIKVVASRSMNLRTRVSLKDLAAVPWVLSQDGCGMRATLRRALESQGLPFNVGVEASGADLQLSLVARGAGIGLVPSDLLADSHCRNQLKVLSVSDFKVSVVAWLVHRPLPPRLEAPVALLLAQLRKAMAGRRSRDPSA